MLNPSVCVFIVTYNHADSIEKAIKSVLNQKTNFPFKVIVLDDASIDGTSEIIEKYTHLENFTHIKREKNLGGAQNVYQGLKLIDTKYYAHLEGDDYWCDENKLQTQVDILENNPDCSFCGHNTLVKYTNSNKQKPFLDIKTQKFSFPPKKMTSRFYIEPHTSSKLCRSECLDLDEFKDLTVYTYDIATNFYFLTKGKLYYIDKIMSVYNYTNKGIISSLNGYEQRFQSASVISTLNSAFEYKYNKILSRLFATRLNLNFIQYLILKYCKNTKKLKSMYEKILKNYNKKYMTGCDVKPIFKITFPISKKKRIVLELKREKDRV